VYDIAKENNDVKIKVNHEKLDKNTNINFLIKYVV